MKRFSSVILVLCFLFGVLMLSPRETVGRTFAMPQDTQVEELADTQTEDPVETPTEDSVETEKTEEAQKTEETENTEVAETDETEETGEAENTDEAETDEAEETGETDGAENTEEAETDEAEETAETDETENTEEAETDEAEETEETEETQTEGEEILALGIGGVYGPYIVTDVLASGNQTINSPGRVYEVAGGSGIITITGGTAISPVVLILNNTTRSGASAQLQILSSANVILYLAEGTVNKFTSTGTGGHIGTDNFAGISVAPNATFTIQGPGRLEANGGNGGAGIGGSYWNASCGTVTIENGAVVATGDGYGAGIGGSMDGAGGTITVKGGYVEARGGTMGAAGIGGSAGGSVGIITITGGEVRATGGDSGAGIGSGDEATAGTVVISGGKVTAQGGEEAAGIGGGYSTDSGTVTITGGDIEATGGQLGAGIGGGCSAPGGITNISGGNIRAIAGPSSNPLLSAAGIGGGGNGIAQSTVISSGDITISGGTIYARGTNEGAGIGSGPGAAAVGTIRITGGIIDAHSQASDASGVGGGKDSKVNVIITGGSVYSACPQTGSGQTKDMIRVNYNPNNGAENGNQLVYLIGVKLIDDDQAIIPGKEFSIEVPGAHPYIYAATTNGAGIAYLWLPAEDYSFLTYFPDIGSYFDFTMTVHRPDNPEQYDPATNTAVIQVLYKSPLWSFAIGPQCQGVKVYGDMELILDINHNNPGANPSKAIAGVKWFRESISNPTCAQSTFDAGYEAAVSGNKGAGGAGETLNLISGNGPNEQHYAIQIDRNGRYWVQIHYISANIGRDVYHVAYLDVDTIYTPVSVYVRDWNELTNVLAKKYTLQTDPLQYGIPYDLDGTILSVPSHGFDMVTYHRNTAMPLPGWVMKTPGDPPFDDTASSASFSVITLDKNIGNHEDGTQNSSLTAYYFTVNYNYVTTNFVIVYSANGGTGTDYIQDTGISSSAAIVNTITLSMTDFQAPNDLPDFKGWNTKPNGSGTAYLPGGSITVTGNVALYAQWGDEEPFYCVTIEWELDYQAIIDDYEDGIYWDPDELKWRIPGGIEVNINDMNIIPKNSGLVKVTNYSTREVTVELEYINNPSHSLSGSFYSDSGYNAPLAGNKITLPRGPGKEPEDCDENDEANIHPQVVWMKLEGDLGTITVRDIAVGRVTVTLTCE